MSKQKGALSPFGGSFFNDLSNRTSFASLYLAAGVVPKSELVQFPTLLVVVSRQGSGHTDAGTISRLRAHWL